MRTPLNDVLHNREDAPGEEDPGRGLAVLFETAERRENAYAAERLREIYEVAERALSLGTEAAESRLRPAEAGQSWMQKGTSLAAGALLAASAPIVAAESVLLAAASGIAAVAAILLPLKDGRQRPRLTALPAPDRERRAAKLEAVASAADRALQAMVEPRRLPAPARAETALAQEDVLALVQDALALGREVGGEAGEELAVNAERLARRLGFEPVFEGEDDLFEVMIDPAIPAPLVLRPALRHGADTGRSISGVMVKRREG